MNILYRASFAALLLLGGLLVGCGEPNQDYKNDDDDRSAEATAGGDRQAMTASDSSQNDYPRDKVQENTNLEDNNPMEIGAVTSLIEKRELLALLLRQKNDMEQRVSELESMPGNPSNNTVVQGDVDKLRLYLEKLDLEILKVRKAQAGSMTEVSESALGAVKGAGALMQSSVMRIDRGF